MNGIEHLDRIIRVGSSFTVLTNLPVPLDQKRDSAFIASISGTIKIPVYDVYIADVTPGPIRLLAIYHDAGGNAVPSRGEGELVDPAAKFSLLGYSLENLTLI